MKKCSRRNTILDMLHLGLKAVVNSTLFSKIYRHNAEGIFAIKSQENKNQ
jgi:hypothetical protein